MPKAIRIILVFAFSSAFLCFGLFLYLYPKTLSPTSPLSRLFKPRLAATLAGTSFEITSDVPEFTFQGNTLNQEVLKDKLQRLGLNPFRDVPFLAGQSEARTISPRRVTVDLYPIEQELTGSQEYRQSQKVLSYRIGQEEAINYYSGQLSPNGSDLEIPVFMNASLIRKNHADLDTFLSDVVLEALFFNFQSNALQILGQPFEVYAQRSGPTTTPLFRLKPARLTSFWGLLIPQVQAVGQCQSNNYRCGTFVQSNTCSGGSRNDLDCQFSSQCPGGTCSQSSSCDFSNATPGSCSLTSSQTGCNVSSCGGCSQGSCQYQGGGSCTPNGVKPSENGGAVCCSGCSSAGTSICQACGSSCPSGQIFCADPCINACRPNTMTCAQWQAQDCANGGGGSGSGGGGGSCSGDCFLLGSSYNGTTINNCGSVGRTNGSGSCGSGYICCDAPSGCQGNCSRRCGQNDGCGNLCPTTDLGNPSDSNFISPSQNAQVTPNAQGRMSIVWTASNKAEDYQLQIYQATSPQNDRTAAGYAISGGAISGYSSARAFDKDGTTTWRSSQTGSSVPGSAWLGQNFGANRVYTIRALSLQQGNASGQRIVSAAAQYSDDGATWTATTTLDLIDDAANHYYSLPASGPHRYWRLLANAAPTSNWEVKEMSLYEEADANLPVVDLTASATSYVFTPTSYAYVLRVRARNITCSPTTYSNWSNWRKFTVVGKITGNFYADPNGLAAFSGSTCSLTGANPLAPGGTAAIGGEARDGTSRAGNITNTTYTIGSVLYWPSSYSPNNIISLIPGTDTTGAPLTCSCPAGCRYSGIASPQSGVGFYLRPLALSNGAWWQTIGGSVYAGNTSGAALTSKVPVSCIPEDSCTPAVMTRDNAGRPGSAGIAVTGGGDIDTRADAGNQQSYLQETTPPIYAQGSAMTKFKENYAYFYRLYSLGLNPSDDFANPEDALKPPAPPVGGKAAYYHAGDVTIQQAWNVSAGEQIVVFVNGNLLLKDPGKVNQLLTVAPGGFLAFIVSGDIVIDPSLGWADLASTTPNVSGVFIADGILKVQGKGASTGGDDKFVGEGSFVGWTGVELQRDYDDGSGRAVQNGTHPTELFIFRPDFVRSLPERMARSQYIWQETN